MVAKRITAITAQKRNPNRVNVYLDGEFSFSLSRIVAAWLVPGDLVDQKKIEELLEKDTDEKVFQAALRFLEYRPRTEREIRVKLQQKGVEPQIAEAVVLRLRNSGMVRDEVFAQAWVESRNAFRPRSQRLVRYELRSKGIDDALIDKALQGSAEDKELALRAAEKQMRRYSSLEWKEFQTKMTAFLARKGFSYDVISATVRNAWNELQSEQTTNENEELGE
jgi:regulatory protein